jgi:hypothetical protein
MKRSFKYISGILLLTMLLFSISCKKDFTDPSAVRDDQAFTSPQAVTGIAVGLQKKYSTNRAGTYYNIVAANGFTTYELLLLNQGNLPETQLNTGGGSVDGTNTILGNVWTASNKIIFDADNIINYTKTLGDKGYASGLLAYTSIFKALSIGTMSMFWPEVPVGIGQNVGFMDRQEGFKLAIAVLDTAINAVAANAISAKFLTNIPVGIDIPNTLLALKARYALYLGNYDLALATANSVDLTKKSVFNFDPVFLNPIFETATSTNNVFQPIDSTLGLPVGIQPDLNDKRVPFYTSINTSIAPRFRINGFGAANLTPIPIYLPGEMILIKAECYARKHDVDNGLKALNLVVTKLPSADLYGVGAALPEIIGPIAEGDLLTQIYRNRCIEMYMFGLKLEDERRFGRPLAERKRNLFPYPFAERDNNPNTPPDPSF